MKLYLLDEIAPHSIFIDQLHLEGFIHMCITFAGKKAASRSPIGNNLHSDVVPRELLAFMS